MRTNGVFVLGVMLLMVQVTMAQFPPIDELPERSDPPPALEMFDGSPVTTPEAWHTRRRPELIALFEHYMYGSAPPAPEIHARVVQTTPVLDGDAVMKQVVIEFGPEGHDRDGRIDLLMFVPAKADGPVPVFLGLNFRGNHAVIDHPDVPLARGWVRRTKDHRAQKSDRGAAASRWPIELAIERGYAVATFYNGDIDPDRHDWSDGIHPLYYKDGQTQPGPHEWATIAAWAWGLSRAADYLVTDPQIDGDGMIVIGHSRNGKTALLAGALDQRFAIVIPSQAGCGGTAPSRGTIGESVERINTVFPHWFNDTFPKFNKQVQKLPFDQHCLMALVAPRPLLLTNATGDQWANPSGQFEMLKLSEPVYELLGVEGCGADAMPPENQLVNTRLGYFIRPGKHDMTAVEWTTWLDFADRHLPE